MAPPSVYSDIDDSFWPNFIPPQPQDSHSLSTFNGARSGHWTVPSRSSGAIDDRCPTVWVGTALEDERNSVGGAAITPIDHSLLKRLGKAVVEQKRDGESMAQGGDAGVDVVEESVLEIAKPAQPARFYLPKSLPNGNATNQLQPGVSKARPWLELPQPPTAASSPVRPPTQCSAKPLVTADVAPGNSIRAIKIKGKNGREAVVQLPTRPKMVVKPAPSPPITKIKEASLVKVHEKLSESKETRKESTSRADAAKRTAARARAPEKDPATKPDESVTLAHDGLCTTASVMLSKAASLKGLQEAVRKLNNNSTTPQSHEYKAFETIDAGGTEPAVKEPAEPRLTPSNGAIQTTGCDSSEPSVLNRDWATIPASHQETKLAEKGWASHALLQPKTKRPIYGMPHEWQGQSPTPQEHGFDGNNGSVGPTPAQSHQHHQSPTVFAGRGWVSPHPLSVASTGRTSPPQSHITLPVADSGDERQLSYENFKALKSKLEDVEAHDSPQLQDRNISRTDSIISAKVLDLAKKISRIGSAVGSAKSDSNSKSQIYHVPRVESEHGSRQSFEAPIVHEGFRCRSSAQSQHVRWSPSVRNGSAGGATGWGALHGVDSDGVSDGAGHKSGTAIRAYGPRLNDIVASEGRSEHVSSKSSKSVGEVQLSMPWDARANTALPGRARSHISDRDDLPNHFTW